MHNLIVKQGDTTPTNQNEGNSNDVAEKIGPEWLIIFPITLCKESNVGVYVVSAQTLTDKAEHISF